MQPSKKFASDVGITFLASTVTLPLGFVIQTSKSFRRYLGADDLGLYRMTSTLYGIAMLIAALGTVESRNYFVKKLHLNLW
jgi:O-antigen/teichoic acid export membrane protein